MKQEFHKKYFQILLILMMAITCGSSTNAQTNKVYQAKNGIVMMEAENSESSLDLWVKRNIEGNSGSGSIEFTGNTVEGKGTQRSPLLYKFKIEESGDYVLMLRGQRSDKVTLERKDIANDAYVRVEGNYTPGKGGTTNIKYLRNDQKLYVNDGGYQDETGSYNWKWAEKLDIHGLTKQPYPIYNFKAGETYTLFLSGRSTSFCIDRILFVKSTVNDPNVKSIIKESDSFDSGSEEKRYTYDALNHFTKVDAGEIPFYTDRKRNALAINAANTQYRNKYAKATTSFSGESGTYDITLTTLSESDGECSYRLLINNKVVGTYQNTRITTVEEYAPQKISFNAIAVNQNDEIAIEANSHTNKIFPEGNDGGTAWARGRWQSVSMKPTIYQGRIAVVSDGNYRDSDDIVATPVSLAIIKSFGLEHRLVHYSHSCDLKPGINDPGGDFREAEMQLSCDGTASRWEGFDHLTFYNCVKQKQAAVTDLTTQINKSTETNPLWIIEAGEPDIIWEALNKSNLEVRVNVFIISHHPANDRGDYYNLNDVMDLGIPNKNLHYIPDQNSFLKSPLRDWHWARDHEDDRIKWLWDRGIRAQSSDMDYSAIVGHFDCSDAGMVYYWATIDHMGDQEVNVSKLKNLFLNYLSPN